MNSITGLVTEVSNNFYAVKTLIGTFKNVPSCIGSCLVNDSVTLVFSNPSEHRNPVIINKLNSGVSIDSNRLLTSKIMFGNGQWVTPESDFLNSCGLTIPSNQVLIRLDGLRPGTLTTLSSFPRFSTGSDLYGQWEDWISSSDQLGLLSFTSSSGDGGSVTVLAVYSTEWFRSAYIGGYIGKIREYSIAGSGSGIADRDIYFEGGQEHRGGRESSRLAMGRRQGYFFVDLVTDSRGIYIIPLETGIYAFRRFDGAMRKTNWVQDVLNPTNSGSVSVYGKYVLGSGWAGYDKSESALAAFNASLQGADPAAAYLADPTFGWLGRIKLPDDSTRGVLRLYTRISEEVDPDNYGLAYAYSEIDLKGRIPGKTTRRIFSNGIYFNVARALLQSDGSPLTAPGGGDLAFAARIKSNLQSLRWPWLIAADRIEAWLSVCSQSDGPTSADPGQCYWTLYSLDVKRATPDVTVRNQLVTPATPATIERFPGILATRTTEILADAAASRAVDGGDDAYYPSGYLIGFSNTFEDGHFVHSDYYLAGYFYDGEDPALPADGWTEEDRWIGHPLPGDLASPDYTVVGPSTDVGLDAIVPGSGASPTGAKDLDGNHYEAASEPIHILDDLQVQSGYILDPAGLLIPGGSVIKATLVKSNVTDTFRQYLYAGHRYAERKYTCGHRTWLTKTSHDGTSNSKADISERFTWSNSTADRATNLPLLGSVWQIEPVGDCLLVLRQGYWSVTAGKPDLAKREPYLEIYTRSAMTRLRKISLHPPGDTGRALFCRYDLAPFMRVGVDVNGKCWALIYTEWITEEDDNAINRLELVQHQITHIAYKVTISRYDHIWKGKKENGYPLPIESSNFVIANNKAYWIEKSNSLVEYVSPP